MFLLFLLRFTVDPSGTYAATAGIIFVIVVIFLAVGLQIDSACKTVEKALRGARLTSSRRHPPLRSPRSPSVRSCPKASRGDSNSWEFA